MFFEIVNFDFHRCDGTKKLINQSNQTHFLIFWFIFWLIMSSFIEGQWKTDKDNRMSGHMTKILFPVPQKLEFTGPEGPEILVQYNIAKLSYSSS